MATKMIGPARAKKQARNALDDPLRLDGTMIALSKAHAAWWLLDEMENGGLVRPAGAAVQDDGLDEIQDWLSDMALNTLHEALDEAEAAYRKSRDGQPPVAA